MVCAVEVEDSGKGMDLVSKPNAFSNLFLQPSRLGSEWDWPSVARLLRRMVDGCGLPPRLPRGNLSIYIVGGGECDKSPSPTVFVIDDDAAIRDALQSLISSDEIARRTLRLCCRVFAARTIGCARLSCSRCKVARDQRAQLSEEVGRSEPFHPRDLHNGPRRHSHVGSRYEGWSGRVFDQTIPRSGSTRCHTRCVGEGSRQKTTGIRNRWYCGKSSNL